MYYEPTFDYVPDQGTIHLNVLAADGSAVALSGTINFLLVELIWLFNTHFIHSHSRDSYILLTVFMFDIGQ